MSTIKLTYRLRHLLLGTMLALSLAYMGTAAASAAPLKLICEAGDQRCDSSLVADSAMSVTVYLPIVSAGGDVMAAADGTLYVCVLEPDDNTQ